MKIDDEYALVISNKKNTSENYLKDNYSDYKISLIDY